MIQSFQIHEPTSIAHIDRNLHTKTSHVVRFMWLINRELVTATRQYFGNTNCWIHNTLCIRRWIELMNFVANQLGFWIASKLMVRCKQEFLITSNCVTCSLIQPMERSELHDICMFVTRVTYLQMKMYTVITYHCTYL